MSRSSLIISFAVVILPSDDFRKRQIFMQKIISNGNTATKNFLPKPTKGKRERTKKTSPGEKDAHLNLNWENFFICFRVNSQACKKQKMECVRMIIQGSILIKRRPYYFCCCCRCCCYEHAIQIVTAF